MAPRCGEAGHRPSEGPRKPARGTALNREPGSPRRSPAPAPRCWASTHRPHEAPDRRPRSPCFGSWRPGSFRAGGTLDARATGAEPHRMHPDAASAEDLLGALLAGLHATLGEDLSGLYLYGSAASGGFEPGVSDVDLVAVTAATVGRVDLAALHRMHDALVGQFPDWANRVEVVYVARATLASFRTSRGAITVISPGESLHRRTDRASEWLQNWYLVRSTGITLAGPEPATVIPPIEWEEFVAATVRYADELRTRDTAGSGAGMLAYTILTSCRALRVVTEQVPSSKVEAAAWAGRLLP